MHLYELQNRFFKFDGLTLFLLVVLVPAVLFLPVWMFISQALGLDRVISFPVWLDYPLRLILGIFLSFLFAFSMRWEHGYSRVRIRVVAGALLVAILILAVLQVVGAINLF